MDDFGALPIENAAAPPKNGLQEWGNRNPNLARIPATVAQGATDFVNSLRSYFPGAPDIKDGKIIPFSDQEYDRTNYFDEYGTTPNLLTNGATGIIAETPYAFVPGGIAERLGLMGTGSAEWLARRGIDAAIGMGASDALSKGKGIESSTPTNILNGLIYGGGGALGEYLPRGAAKIVETMQKNKLPTEAIVEGNRAAEFPDIGNIVGNPKATAKWDSLKNSWFSPAKKTQEAFIPEVQGVKYANLQNADEQAMQLYKELAGKPRIRAGETPPNTLQEAISNDLTRTYKTNSKTGGALFKEIEPDLQKAFINDFSNTETAAKAILNEAKTNSSLGVTDEALRKDIINRAENAAEFTKKSPLANSKIVTLTDKEKGRYPLNSIIKEERNLSDIAADLKASGNNAAARYYENLAKSYQGDINAVLQGSYPDVFEKLSVARDYWKNNVVPFRESSTVRSLLNNTFDQSEAALNLSNTLTNGKHSQLLNILPADIKNRIAADLLYKHGFNAIGDTAHLATDLSKAVNNIEPARLSDILGADTKSTLKNISKSVEQNATVLNDLNKSTKTVGSEGPNAVADISTHGVPGLFARIGNSALNSTTAPFWSRFLNAEQSPEIFARAVNNTPTTLADIRAIEAARPVTFSPARGAIANILSKPNITRIPVAGAVEGAKERKEKKNHGNR